MASSLAVKYRPKSFEETLGQSSTIKILERQLELGKLSHCYLFAGASGAGKTSLSRAFANRINKGKGSPIEIDAASNNGVDAIRAIVDSARERAVDSEYKIFIIDECVTGDTEILTSDGYKRIDSLNKKEKIAQYLDDGTIEFVDPIDYIEKDYIGDMFNVSVRNGKRSVLMSPHHVQPLLKNNSNEIIEKYVSDIKFNQNYSLITSGKGCGSKSTLTALDKLAIASQADGYYYGVRKRSNLGYWIIGLSDTTKINNFLSYAKAANIDVKELKGRSETHVRRFAYNLPANITKKLTTYFNLDFSYDGAKAFLDEIVKWDGSKKSGYDKFYSCVDIDNVNFVSAIATLAGYSADQISYDDQNPKHSTIHILRLTETFTRTAEACSKVKEENFNGKIYCVKVPSHKIIIRAQGFTFVTGNCHSISSQGWQAFLKCIEEPPEYTIFMFCTTNPEKVPETIQNRVMRLNISKVDTRLIAERLKFICKQEGFTNYDEACDYLSKLGNGGVRDSIAYLEKCANYNPDLSINNVLECLGNFSYDSFFNLTGALLNGDEAEVLSMVEDYYNSGNDLKMFIENFLEFSLDLAKYCLFKSMSVIKIPSSLESRCIGYSNIPDILDYTNNLVSKLLDIKNAIRQDINPKNTVEVMLINICRGV